MTQAPTLYQFEITLQHTDRGIEHALNVRTARHPSETLARVWLRVLAFAWLWQERIAFGPGLSDPDAPDLLAENFTGDTVLWVRVGKADAVKVQRVVDQHNQAEVAIVFESKDKMDAFIASARQSAVRRLDKISLAAIDPELVSALSAIDERRSKVSITFAGDHCYIERAGKTFDGAIERASVS